MEGQITVGEFLAAYLRHLGIEDYFGVPGDFNLLLLDEMLHNKDVRFVSCCNELNAGYAADGYARAKGIGALVITYSVGALSAVNAIAGCYAENLPVIIISGGPNSNSTSRGELIHHSLGELKYYYVKRIFGEITAMSVIIQHPSEVVEGIHNAISAAIASNKPVYIEIACNIVQEKILPPYLPSSQSLVMHKQSDPRNLEEAVNSAIEMLNWANSPVIVIGSKVRVACNTRSCRQVRGLIDKSQYATAVMADAKGMLHDTHPSNIGVYWGKVSIPTHATQEIIEASDARIFIGAVFTDYTTCGGTIILENSKMIQVNWHHVQIGTKYYCNVEMLDFIEGITEKVNANRNALDAYLKKVPHHHQTAEQSTAKDVWVTNFKHGMSDKPEDYVTMQRMFMQIQKLILDKAAGAKYTLITETGSVWFGILKLRLPLNIANEVQMQYGSIGWSVGATLGYAIAAAKEQRRVIALIGDGSFQMTAQEVSTMIRYHANPIIFLVNNFGYTIEEEIHSGPYNRIKNWDYAGFMNVFSVKECYANGVEKDEESFGKGMGFRVTTNKDLDTAIEKALAHSQGPSLIEVCIARDDCNTELHLFGKAVAEFNSRKDAIQSR